MHRIGSRRPPRTIIDQRAAGDTGDVAMRAHRAGGCSFLDECHELPDNNGFEPGHLMDHAHRGVLRPFRWITGVARQRRRGLGGTSGRMDEDDLAIGGLDHHERSVVIEHRSFGYHHPILGPGSPAASRIRPRATHPGEPHAGGTAGRLNWLRAGVLGANDGIVSVAGLVVGVAGATSARGPIFTAGLAGLVAGAVSMALGEYVSG